VLVLDKADLGQRRVYELPPFFAFHYGAAWEEADGTLRFDVCASADPTFATRTARDLVGGVLTPAPDPILNLITLAPDGAARMESTGVVAEFPRTDSRLAGSARRYTVHATGSSASPLFHGVAAHDWKTGRSDTFDFGPAHLVEEAVFTPRPGGAAELDGWLLAPSVNLAARASELHVFDARRVADGPVCVWRAGVCLPVGLHGAFVAA
jgi:carotenoid cleavage dioxygenase-like enzyme